MPRNTDIGLFTKPSFFNIKLTFVLLSITEYFSFFEFIGTSQPDHQLWRKYQLTEFSRILQLLKENEAILKKFHLLESKILAILNLEDFFESLLNEMMAIFKLPYVWVTVIENSKLANMIELADNSEKIQQRINFISRDTFKNCFKNISQPLLLNTDLAPYRVFFPQGKIHPIRSIALAPVFIDGEIMGSLNQGDTNQTRFEADMDTSLLEQLMVKISLCLSNVMAHEKLKFFAYHDPLTGLLNRRAFENEFQREFSRSQRHGLNLSVVFTDLDDFKQINDQYGHGTGDKALQHVANTLESMSRKEDIVSRFAGDEFVILLPETSPEKAEALMGRIQELLDSQPLKAETAELSISLSYGIASTDECGFIPPEQLLKKADKNLYAVKSEKKKERFQASG